MEIIEQLRFIAEQDASLEVNFEDQTEVDISPEVAQRVLDLFDSWSEDAQFDFIDRFCGTADEFISYVEQTTIDEEDTGLDEDQE